MTPALPFSLPSFKSADLRFTKVIYELKEIVVGGGSATLDPGVISWFDSATLNGEIKVTDNEKVGERTFELIARFDLPIRYYQSYRFKLTILHQCTINIATPSKFEFPVYNITDPKLSISFDPWGS